VSAEQAAAQQASVLDRLADGTPAATADRFARAVLTGDASTVRRLELFRPGRPEGRPVAAGKADAELGSRRSTDCLGLPSRNTCYGYRTAKRKLALWVAVRCEVRRWRVSTWFRLA
jgi:hypothetical protein